MGRNEQVSGRPPSRFRLALFWLTLVVASCGGPASEQPEHFEYLLRQGVPRAALEAALSARAEFADEVRKGRTLAIVDYSMPSSEKRLFLIDAELGLVERFLVAHGKGSDPDHDGQATDFSNTPDSNMTSLGAYVTGPIYYGKHGLSLRLKGLEASNSNAEDRAIVMHGADYVSPEHSVIGRSFGCPAIEHQYRDYVIGRLRDGAFFYAYHSSPAAEAAAVKRTKEDPSG